VQVCVCSYKCLFWCVLVEWLLVSFVNSVAQLSSRDLIVCVVWLIVVCLFCVCVFSGGEGVG
jgi:hypothetical protein